MFKESTSEKRYISFQVYVGLPSPARDENADYVAWGNSSIVDPWGKVVSKAEEKEEIIMADIDIGYMEQIREQIPISKQRRNDLYAVEKK